MPSPLFHPEIMDHDAVVSAQQTGVVLTGEPEPESRNEEHQEALRFALDQFSLMALDKVDSLDGTTTGTVSENCNGSGAGGGGYVDLPLLDHPGGSRGSPSSCSPSPEYYGTGGYHMAPHTHPVLGDQSAALCNRKRSVNMTECVPVPSSEHVAEIVGRQGGFNYGFVMELISHTHLPLSLLGRFMKEVQLSCHTALAVFQELILFCCC